LTITAAAAGAALLIAAMGSAPAHTAGPGVPAGVHTTVVKGGSPARTGGISPMLNADRYYEVPHEHVVLTPY